NDTLDGGSGNDIMAGGIYDTWNGYFWGYGNDTYLFGRGDGSDSIRDIDTTAGNLDRLLFKSGVAASDIVLSQTSNNLVLKVSGTTDQIQLDSYLNGQDFGSGHVELIRFDDGTVWDGTSVQGLLAGTALVGGTAADTLTGSSANERLSGLDGDDTLSAGGGNDLIDGGTGVDAMTGGTGNDTFVVDNVGDSTNELANEGVDTVRSSITWSLGNDLENLILTGNTEINGSGNAAANRLFGNAAANRIDGGAGADFLAGGKGNDTYVVDNAGDVVQEDASEGLDAIETSLSYGLGTNVENLRLTGTASVNGTGNALNNTLLGNGAANVLSGGAGDDVLDGAAGTDTLIGGQGDDSYVVDDAGDIVTELAGEGVDLVTTGLSWTLGANLENLSLTGSAAVAGTGNELANVLLGNGSANTLAGAAGNDTLDGGAGLDTLIGGAGDDTYVVDRTGDVTTEAAGEGVDSVRSSVNWTLDTHIENLALVGNAAIDATGNGLANVLTGNTGNNTLTGNAGADRLDGGSGTDTLIGGTEGDTYLFGRGYGVDTVQENDATAGVIDQVVFAAGISQADVSFARNGLALEASIAGTSDKLIVRAWYLGAQYRVEEFRFADGTVVTGGQVQQLIQAMASFDTSPVVDSRPPMRPAPWRTADLLVHAA
ncbi:MAG: calcium-binding protein, partial [Rubrivivax sp.]